MHDQPTNRRLPNFKNYGLNEMFEKWNKLPKMTIDF